MLQMQDSANACVMAVLCRISPLKIVGHPSRVGCRRCRKTRDPRRKREGRLGLYRTISRPQTANQPPFSASHNHIPTRACLESRPGMFWSANGGSARVLRRHLLRMIPPRSRGARVLSGQLITKRGTWRGHTRQHPKFVVVTSVLVCADTNPCCGAPGTYGTRAESPARTATQKPLVLSTPAARKLEVSGDRSLLSTQLVLKAQG